MKLRGTAGSRLFYDEAWNEYLSHPQCAMLGCRDATSLELIPIAVPGHVWWQNGTMDDAFPEASRSYCFTCALWLEWHDNQDEGVVLVREDRVITRFSFDPLAPLLPKTYGGMRGFGGRLYHVRFFTDNYVTEVNNLWYNGVVPSWLESLFEPNAEFI